MIKPYQTESFSSFFPVIFSGGCLVGISRVKPIGVYLFFLVGFSA